MKGNEKIRILFYTSTFSLHPASLNYIQYIVVYIDIYKIWKIIAYYSKLFLTLVNKNILIEV